MDVFCLSKENAASIQGRRKSKQEILSRWGSTLLWADLVQHCSATPKHFASVPLLKSSLHTEPRLGVPPFSTIHWELAFRLPAGCPPLAPACGMLTGSSGHEEHLSRALLSLFSAGTGLWHYVRSSLKWGFLAEHLQLSSSLPVPRERGQEPISLTEYPVQASHV